MKDLQTLENNLINSLRDVQSQCIGLFKPYASYVWELVLDDYEGVLTTWHIGNLFGLSTTCINKDTGNYQVFPDNKTMEEMMYFPLEFHAWFNKNCVNYAKNESAEQLLNELHTKK